MRANLITPAAAVLALSALLSAAAVPAQAAGPGFQYVGPDDRVHGVAAPKGCVEAEGGGGRAVTNHTGLTASLYREAHCRGPVVAVMRPDAVAQVRPSFASVRFSVPG
ncbi:hypothetical protein WDV06_23745 [Streptomyces racemochromogenes]|uniref:Uncharacterized protein n=1 Tax=Streptomyces racemochromogenes TaxID=67353 RepID=A0ABW7PI55_9ACTN